MLTAPTRSYRRRRPEHRAEKESGKRGVFDNVILDNGAASGRLLKVTNNDNAVTLTAVQFFDTNIGDLSFNFETDNASADICVATYDRSTLNPESFGGPLNENDNLGGNVDPGRIVWGVLTPVMLRYFDATRVAGGVALEWQTAAEWNTLGFALERAPAGSRDFTMLYPPLIRAAGSPPSARMKPSSSV